ncbi:MAG: YraN family protein [Oscillospiraceae bacterium]|nr:YraN family protein [Oscillospiraceae bacterium]
MNSGQGGERAAELYLLRRGYKILARNYRCRFGEIDLVAVSAGYIVFAEVKTRRPHALVSGEQSVDARKQSRLTAAACDYLRCRPTELQPRFDVIVVEAADGAYRITNHIENAF